MAVAPRASPSVGRFDRRSLLKWIIRAAFGAFGLAFALPALAIRTLTNETEAVAGGDELVFALGPEAGQPLRADALKPGTAAQAFPKGKTTSQSNLIEVVRIAAGQGTNGIVAYSAICTHLGCVVHAALNERGLIACPCHRSLFDPKAGAQVVGGPAPRPLPSLPVTSGPNGVIVTAGDFSGPIGPT